MSGSVSGVCNGPISGKFDGGQGGKIQGKTEPSCQIGLLTQNYQINFSGLVYLKDKRIDVNWSGNIPYQNSGSFSLYF